MKLELPKIENSTLRFRFRKAFRFAIRPVDATRDALYDKFIQEDEERAWHLLETKAIIRAEHASLVLRAIQSLPDPLPDAQAIEKALRRVLSASRSGTSSRMSSLRSGATLPAAAARSLVISSRIGCSSATSGRL